MRKFLYVVLGLMLFAGAAGLLYARQMQVADDDGPAIGRQAEPGAKQAPDGDRVRSLRNDRTAGDRRERRIDRGLAQYRRTDGTWNTVSAVVDILNVVVGIVGIALALSGMRARREARRDA